MGLNEAKGNMYDFVTHTWNTVKGACPHDCSYCYMKRFGTQRPVRFDEKELRTDLGSGNFIFVGSSCDMFAGGIPTEWIIKTLDHCEAHNKNKYLFQSKNPSGFGWLDMWRNVNIDATLCTTIETNRWYPEIMRESHKPEDRALAMSEFGRFPRYVTIEPIMDFDLDELVDMVRLASPIQVNIGSDSGRNNLPEPSWAKVQALIEELNAFTKVAKKRNLGRLAPAPAPEGEKR